MTLKLPRLSHIQIADKDGNSTRELERYWDQLCLAIEDAFNQLSDTVDAIATAQAAAEAAQAAAVAAQTAADAAQASADSAMADAGGVNSYANLANSYVLDDLTTTGHDAGSDASIIISNHHRRYGDGTVVAVTGGSITGLAYSTAYSIYYDDPARAGGAETYHAVLATSSTDAFPSAANPNRHFVGTIITPAALAADTTGKNSIPPTYPDI